MNLPHVLPFPRTPIYFFTACGAGRKPILAGEEAMRILGKIRGKSAELDGWFVGRFVRMPMVVEHLTRTHGQGRPCYADLKDQKSTDVGRMPDHVHFFASPAADAKSRADWCTTWTSISSRRTTKASGVSPPIWQAGTFEPILRSAESYAEKWAYVVADPVRAGLVREGETWPWQAGDFFAAG